MLNHMSLQTYYHTVFNMVQHHRYTLTELENLVPYELDIFVDFLAAFLKEQEMAQRNK